ncbi:MAG: 16S rRNA (cytosine(1402)-N(4))-methyltransferase [Nitrospirae bacterium GWF2_44_13]|nr:MAG: 16S rRNA (cytosine(1402)-N(4))-methyltransferase [Nitrospirae bacterium GWF2_44_13]OGW64963.1 MAG: 16S rRNA (cytosine(1402)-N(4))-methyltransferase [Nitrospirae bacterium RIFOXYA2_FULL_44_9]
MLREVVMLLKPVLGGVYVDATVGLGGHAEEILKHIGNGRLLGIDRDEEALDMAMKRIPDNRLTLKKGKFSDISRLAAEAGISKADGILLDLGTSMFHLKTAERGFSFLSEEPLDMRMDREQEMTAAYIVNKYPEKEIIRILWEYGEEKLSRKIARAVIDYRAEKKIDTCAELSDIVYRAYRQRGKHHPATKTFQALRIAVNDELNELRKGLNEAAGILKSGGRLCVISYHSLEDRIVKNFIRDEHKQGGLRMLTKKPIAPSGEEVRSNPSARSAKLRGAEKI